MNYLMECITKRDAYRLVNCVSFGTILSAFTLVLLFSYWLIYPYKPLEVKEPIEIINHTIQSGDNVLYEIEYCKNMDIPVTIRRRFVDGLVYHIPEFTTQMNDMGCREQIIAIEVPKKLPPGEYKLYTEFVYHVNPIRDVVVKVDSENFIVL